MAKQSINADDLRAELDSAIKRGEFRLEFQPIVRLGAATVAGGEALVRWRHPRRGTIPPAEFLPAAEQAGLIGAIGSFVIEQACQTASGWPRSAERQSFISINVVPGQLSAPSAAAQILDVIARSTLEPRLVIIELTSGVRDDLSEVSRTLDELREAGVRIALDDFGMATSFADLKHLPIDMVKLAREFVVDVEAPAEQSAFTLALLNVADVRGVEVVAKGVESREQAWRLAELGCRYGQGFFFSKPLGASGMLAVLRQGTLRA